MEEIVYLNGSLVPRHQAKISPFDHGFLYGYGLFETMRSYSGHIFRLDRHLARLTHSAEILGLELGLTTFELEEAVYKTLRANGLTDARIRLTLSAGEGEIAPEPPSPRAPTLLIVTQGYTPPQCYDEGFRAAVSHIRQNSQTPLAQIKSANYLNNLLARRQARAMGADEAILLNDRGFLAEGSSTNIFLVSGEKLSTPSQESGILPGITREAVIELAAALGIEMAEREVRLEELLQADEAFFTNSLLEIMPLAEVDGHPIGSTEASVESAETLAEVGSGRAGEVTKGLILAYKQLVEKEVHLQKEPKFL